MTNYVPKENIEQAIVYSQQLIDLMENELLRLQNTYAQFSEIEKRSEIGLIYEKGNASVARVLDQLYKMRHTLDYKLL